MKKERKLWEEEGGTLNKKGLVSQTIAQKGQWGGWRRKEETSGRGEGKYGKFASKNQ